MSTGSTGLDQNFFKAFIEQLQRYVRDHRVPAEQENAGNMFELFSVKV